MNKIILLTSLLSAFIGGNLYAAQFTVGVEENNYYPLYTGIRSSYTGYARELLDAFGKKYGYTFKYVALPTAHLFNEFLTGNDLDFKFPDNPQWQFDMKKGVHIIYSDPAVSVVEGLLVQPGNKGKFTRSTLKSIATIRGFTAWPILPQIKSGAIKVSEVSTFDALVKMGTSGRANAIYASDIVIRYFLKHNLKTPGALVLDPSLPSEVSGFSLSSKNHDDVIKQFNKYLSHNKTEIHKLKVKYEIPD